MGQAHDDLFLYAWAFGIYYLMIIRCPQCDTGFVVPSTAFDKGGRKVRCASCSHTWFQDNTAEPKKKDDIDDFDPGMFADALRETEKNVNEGTKKKKPSGGLIDKIKNDFKNGYTVIAAGFCFILALYFIFQMLFTNTLIHGEGLAFDQIEIGRSDNQIIVNGVIVNSMDEERGVLPIKVTQILNDNIEGDSIIAVAEQNKLDAGETTNFTAIMEDVPQSLVDLNISFVQPTE
jgi:predicted Zn finger-like uncharacterized protein